MEELFTVEGYRNYLINYYRYASDEEKLEQRKKNIDKFSDEYLQTIIKNTENFSSILLEQMKRENNIFKETIFASITLSNISIDIKNGCSGGFPSDTLVKPIVSGDDSYISEYLLKQSLKGFNIDIVYDSKEERIDDIVAIFPANELCVSCPIEVFDKRYESNSNNVSNKHLVK